MFSAKNTRLAKIETLMMLQSAERRESATNHLYTPLKLYLFMTAGIYRTVLKFFIFTCLFPNYKIRK